jgi:hypothetical protein
MVDIPASFDAYSCFITLLRVSTSHYLLQPTKKSKTADASDTVYASNIQ